jgi:predicted glycosyltransferase
MGVFRVIHPDRLQPSVLMRELRAELLAADAGDAQPSAAIDLRGLARLREAVAELTAELASMSGSFPRPALALP